MTKEEMTELVETHSAMLLRVALTRLSTAADAEDAVQEVFLKVLDRSPRFRDGEHAKAWLIRATLNQASDLRRRRRDDAPLDETLTAETAHAEERLDLLAAVRTLPKAYSGIIHLYYYEGYSIKEIAKLLALPAATVGTRLARGRQRLRELLKEEPV